MSEIEEKENPENETKEQVNILKFKRIDPTHICFAEAEFKDTPEGNDLIMRAQSEIIKAIRMHIYTNEVLPSFLDEIKQCQKTAIGADYLFKIVQILKEYQKLEILGKIITLRTKKDFPLEISGETEKGKWRFILAPRIGE